MQSLEQEYEQPWGIFILDFANEAPIVTGRGLTGPLRKVLRGLVPKRRSGQGSLPTWDRPNLLFICTHQYRHFRFAYFKSPTETGHAEPLTTFGWEPGVPPRTVCEFNLNHLCWPDDTSEAGKWVAEWAKAFDVETVTKKFYEDYDRVFGQLEQGIEGFQDNEEGKENRRLFVQTLMNRLMFLRFVERKGWLRFGDGNNVTRDYLRQLYTAGGVGNSSWYISRLKPLFFEGLAVQEHELAEIIGRVPYLNGGLFESHPLDDTVANIPDEVFAPILSNDGLFYRYNFTVQESTPLDIDVAVDPEMLGKVFEKLTNARRQKGSYYTPRTVVSFMCRETLKGYLSEYYAPLIDEDKLENIGIPEARDLLGRLDKVKVVDPACGSGAYLLGMLQELFRITKLLDTRAETDTPHDAYHRKLNIIQKNLYGVDIDEFAINIARLRLWLSLAVEYEGNDPEPLPNLDFKIESGDSLSAPDPSAAGQLDFFRQGRIREFDRLKAIYMDPVLRARSPGLEQQIEELRQEISQYTHPGQATLGFDWRVEFAEVWSERNGFDIVLANPPYGVAVGDDLRNQYFNQRSDNERGQSKDSYGIFMARGLQLLRRNGTLSYIVSDTWRTIKSHRPLRRRLLETTTIFHVLDLPSWIFDATVNTCVVTLKKTTSEEEHNLIVGDLSGIKKGHWKTLSDNLIAVSGHGPDIQTIESARYTYAQTLIQTYDGFPFFIASPVIFSVMSSPNCVPLGDVAEVKHGLTTGNTRGYIYKEISGRGSYRIATPDLIFDIERNGPRLTDEEKQNGIDPQRFGGRFLVPYDKGGASDPEGGWLPNYYVPTKYYIDWRRTSVDEMKKLPGFRHDGREYYFRSGITFSHTGFYSPTFRVNSKSVFDTAGSCLFPTSLTIETLLGLLNSRLLRYQFKSFINHTVNAAEDPLKEIRLHDISDSTKRTIETLVISILEKQKREPTYPYYLHEQKEIDAVVFRIYGFSDDDVREVELWYCRQYPLLSKAQGILDEVEEKYADHLARCQRILEKPPSYWRSNPILELIAQGESHTLEFKETLEWSVKKEEHAPYLQKESLRTIAAFLNADGGILLIGVSDSGEINGIARDLPFVKGKNLDGFEQKLRNLINDHFNPSPLGNVEIRFEELQEGTVCQINVERSTEPIAYDKDFYIRDGNGTRKLEGRDLADWIQQRTI